MTTYYHGGRPGIQRGAFLLPPDITKAPSCSEFGAAGVHRTDRVYITTSLAAAMVFAVGQRKGCVYEVEPVGELEHDPDCNEVGLSFQVPKARVRRVIRMTKQETAAAREMLLGVVERVDAMEAVS